MFSTPRRDKPNSNSNLNSIVKTITNNNPSTMDTSNSTATSTNHPTTAKANNPAIVFENGTIIGAITTESSDNNNPNAKVTGKNLIIPEIVISASYSSNSLHQSRCDVLMEETAAAEESTALLEAPQYSDTEAAYDVEAQQQHDEFEQFILNRTTSDSNILESSIYSEVQFSTSIGSGSGSGSGGTTAQPQTPANGGMDVLNTSTCSRESRQAKRSRRKTHKSKSKQTPVVGGGVGTYHPPQYTAIFLDPHHAGINGGAANAMGQQIASAAAASPFLNAPISDAAYLQQQYQYYQQRPMVTSLNPLGHHHHHRTLLDPTVAHHVTTDGSIAPGPGGSTLTTPTSTITPPLRISFRKWFSRPSLPFVIGILALGGVACTLGGIVLGSTGLIEHSTQYLSAALLMIGIGVSLLVISGAIWRLSLPDDADECPCYRHMETCRNCNSPYCNNRLMPGSYLYPEFQHRPPPPSYLTSLNECAAMGLLFHPTAAPAAQQAAYSTLRMNTPPPLYRSTNSLSVFVPASSTTSAAITPSSDVPTLPTTVSILPDHNAITMSVVMENLQAQTQQPPLIKEINYLELD